MATDAGKAIKKRWMNIRESINSLRNLKDEALSLRDGMDYEKAIQAAEFCDYVVRLLGDDGAFYGNWQEVAMKTPLHLSDIETVEQQEAIISSLNSAYVSRFDDDDSFRHYLQGEEAYHRKCEQVAAINSAEISNARESMKNYFGADWSSYLFTPSEIFEMANSLSFEDKNLVLDVCNTINSRELKSYAQESRIEGMRKGLSVDELRQDFIEKRVYEDFGSLYDKDFYKWILDEYKSIHNALPEEFISFQTKLNFEEGDISPALASSLRRYAEKVSDDFLSYQKAGKTIEQNNVHGSATETSILNKLSRFIREGNPKLFAQTILDGMTSVGCTIEDVQKRMAELQKSVKDIMFKDPEMHKRLKENENKSKGRESSNIL